MKRLFYSFLGFGSMLAALSAVPAQEPKLKDAPPSETKGERSEPKERVEPRRDVAPVRVRERVEGLDNSRDRPPMRVDDLLPARGGERRPDIGPGGRRPGGPGPGDQGGGRPGPGGRQGFPGGPGAGQPAGMRMLGPDGWPGMPGMGPGGPREMIRYDQDPEMAALIQSDYDLDQQTQELSAKLRSAKKEEQEKIKAEISDVVTKHFDVRQKRRELQIQRMEDELKKLREAMTKRNDSREQIIKRRLVELTGNEDDLGF